MVQYIDIQQEESHKRKQISTQEELHKRKETLSTQEESHKGKETPPSIPPIIKTYVDQEDRIVKEEALKNQGVMLDFIRTQYNNIVNTMNKIPYMIYHNTIESSTSVSNKLYEYVDALGGKNQDNDNDTDTLMIEKPHLSYIDKLRRSNIDAYKQALVFYEKLLAQNMPRKEQCLIIAAYVEREFNTLKNV